MAIATATAVGVTVRDFQTHPLRCCQLAVPLQSQRQAVAAQNSIKLRAWHRARRSRVLARAAPHHLNVVITGGSKGLGFAMTHEFLQAGDDVVICSRDGKRLTAALNHLHQHSAIRPQQMMCSAWQTLQLTGWEWSTGMVLTDLLLQGASPVARRFFNVLAEEPETVAAVLVPRMRAVQGTGSSIDYLSPAAAVGRVLTVKCNPEPVLLAMLNALGVGFDCASIAELEAAAALGVAQTRIIFANPCKRPADFRYAAAHGVETTTFDCPSELHKIAQLHPAFKCVLRIRCDDETAKINLGTKYGADMSEVPELLDLAKALALQVFDLAEAQGFPPLELLDVGGGFTAPCDEETSKLFSQTAAIINSSLDRCFPAGCGVRIISEPGSDSYHGSFRIQVAVDGLEPSFLVLRSPSLPPVLAPALSSSLTPSLTPSSPARAAPTGSPPSTLPGHPSCSLPGSGAPAAGVSPFGAFQTLWTSRIMGISGKDGDKIHEAAQLPLLRVENVEVLHSASLEDLDTLRQPSGASPFQSVDDEIAAAAATAAAGFGAYRSLSVGSDRSQSLQRRLSRAPSAKSRG
eukprot:gene4514-4767_t